MTSLALLTTLLSALPTHPIEIHGDRGARANYPENSLPAFEFALSQGADVLEMDVGVTRDDVLVVYHDLYLNNQLCRGRDGSAITQALAIRKMTWATLQKFECGTSPVNIPQLEDVLKRITSLSHPHSAKIQFNIEAKSLPSNPELSPEPQEFASILVHSIRALKLEDRTIIQSFDHRLLMAIKEIAPKMRTSVLIQGTLPIDPVRMVRLTGADIYSPQAQWVTREQVRILQAVGIKVIPWTVNSEAHWERMLEWGVNGIITDDPRGLRKFLDKKIALQTEVPAK